jgi:pilus assembly protein CpaF
MEPPPDRAAAFDELAGALRERLVAEAGAGGHAGGPDALAAIRALVEREGGLLDAAAREELVARVVERSFGLGPLERLLADPEVDEILVNGVGPARPVWVERRGALEATPVHFASEDELRHAIERILAPLGRRVDEAEPLCDARLPTARGSTWSSRRSPSTGPCSRSGGSGPAGFSADDLVELGTWTAPLRELLGQAVRSRLNVLVSGGTGSGKTTTLNALSGFVPDGERVVTIEDTAELRLQRAHVVRLEARPASVEGRGEVTIRRLVRNALRMRPDRIVVGEVRGPRRSTCSGAMSSGHDGSLCTVHAGRPRRRCGAWRRSRSWPASGCRTPRCASRWRPRSTSWSTRRAWPTGPPGRRRGGGRPGRGRSGHARGVRRPGWPPALAGAAVRRAGRAAGAGGERAAAWGGAVTACWGQDHLDQATGRLA